jgi:hypothetical protein
MQIGSVGKDSDGISKDASDGKCLEMICLDVLADPNNAPAIEQLGPIGGSDAIKTLPN